MSCRKCSVIDRRRTTSMKSWRLDPARFNQRVYMTRPFHLAVVSALLTSTIALAQAPAVPAPAPAPATPAARPPPPTRPADGPGAPAWRVLSAPGTNPPSDQNGDFLIG